MTRSQRQRHFWLWLALTPLLAAGLALALASRPPTDDPPAEDASPAAKEVAP
jgi:hypothetical protein